MKQLPEVLMTFYRATSCLSNVFKENIHSKTKIDKIKVNGDVQTFNHML